MRLSVPTLLPDHVAHRVPRSDLLTQLQSSVAPGQINHITDFQGEGRGNSLASDRFPILGDLNHFARIQLVDVLRNAAVEAQVTCQQLQYVQVRVRLRMDRARSFMLKLDGGQVRYD